MGNKIQKRDNVINCEGHALFEGLVLLESGTMYKVTSIMVLVNENTVSCEKSISSLATVKLLSLCTSCFGILAVMFCFAQEGFEYLLPKILMIPILFIYFFILLLGSRFSNVFSVFFFSSVESLFDIWYMSLFSNMLAICCMHDTVSIMKIVLPLFDGKIVILLSLLREFMVFLFFLPDFAFQKYC